MIFYYYIHTLPPPSVFSKLLNLAISIGSGARTPVVRVTSKASMSVSATGRNRCKEEVKKPGQCFKAQKRLQVVPWNNQVYSGPPGAGKSKDPNDEDKTRRFSSQRQGVGLGWRLCIASPSLLPSSQRLPTPPTWYILTIFKTKAQIWVLAFIHHKFISIKHINWCFSIYYPLPL